MDHNAHLGDMMFSLSAPGGDPGGLLQTDLAPDQKGVCWVSTAAVGVVVLQGMEVAVGLEGVGASEELWARPNFTSVHRRRSNDFVVRTCCVCR